MDDIDTDDMGPEQAALLLRMTNAEASVGQAATGPEGEAVATLREMARETIRNHTGD